MNDGRYVIGQVVGREARVLNSVSIALFATPISDLPAKGVVPEIKKEDIFSIQFSTRDLLDNGQWRVIGSRPVIVEHEQLPHESLRTVNFVGAKVIGSGNITEFANAYFGLVPWDDWADVDYLDRLLISPKMKPKNLIYKP